MFVLYISKGTPDTLKDINIESAGTSLSPLRDKNGAPGKTTLLKLLNGISKPTCGTVTVNGVSTKDVPVSNGRFGGAFVPERRPSDFFPDGARGACLLG